MSSEIKLAVSIYVTMIYDNERRLRYGAEIVRESFLYEKGLANNILIKNGELIVEE